MAQNERDLLDKIRQGVTKIKQNEDNSRQDKQSNEQVEQAVKQDSPPKTFTEIARELERERIKKRE